MSDDAISAVASVPQQKALNPAEPIAKIVALPDNLPQDTPLKGEVTANANGQVTIQTPQGAIVLNTNLQLNIGQKLLVQIADSGHTIALSIEPIVPAVKAPVTLPSQLQPVADPVVIHADAKLADFSPLQASLVRLPPVFDETNLPILIKSMAQIPPQTPLPPALAEGLEKFQLINHLVQQTSLSQPQTALSAAPQPIATSPLIHEQAAVMTALQQVLSPQTHNPAPTSAPQTVLHLQTIPPGQAVSPELLVSLRQQINSLAQIPVKGQMPTEKAPAQTMPLVGLVIQPAVNNSPTPSLAAAQPPVIVLMAAPDRTAQPPQMAGMMNLPIADDISPMAVSITKLQQTPLPGTVVVLATNTKNIAQTPPLITVSDGDAFSKPAPLHTTLGDTWPALENLLENVGQQAPQMLPALQQTLPTPDAQQFPPAMLFFMSVLKNGLTEHWLHDPALSKLTKIEKSGALEQIAKDLQNIAARNDDNLPVDAWRPLPVPLQVNGELMRLQWFYRHPQEDAAQPEGETEGKRKKKKTRFLLNVPKTMLGDIQLDGLVQEQSMELILRTENQLQSEMEIAIRGRYAAALETTGMAGALHFQSGRDVYVKV